MTSTKVWMNPALFSMRAMALLTLDRLNWRHHGIGVLQGYVRENCEPEIRLHIWSKRLMKPGMDVSGDIHDHRFDMVSHVLSGSVAHEEILEEPNPDGDHAMLALTHARAAADTQYHGPTTQLEGRFRVRRSFHTIDAGYSYSFPSQVFHHSPLSDLGEIAVTCVEKHRQQDAPARLLYPIKREPVMAFGHTPDPEVVKAVIEAARERLTMGANE